jgi:RNA polymerase sigma factor (sigma-70 family)
MATFELSDRFGRRRTARSVSSRMRERISVSIRQGGTLVALMSESDKALSVLPLGRSFADFYRSEVAGQVRRAALLTGSSDVAHDVVHEAFVEIFRRWDHLDHAGPYLNRAVLNRCRDVARAQRRRGGFMTRLVADEPNSWDAEPIADLLDVLPFNQRAVIVLRFYVGLNNVEIAEALGCAPGSVGPWLYRALRQLRKVMP